MTTTPTARKGKTVAKSPRKRAGKAIEAQAKIFRFVPRHLLEQVESSRGCHKCGSLFVEVEPAFIHCRYCGSLSRIRGASLLAQEEWEMRSGMRLAS